MSDHSSEKGGTRAPSTPPTHHDEPSAFAAAATTTTAAAADDGEPSVDVPPMQELATNAPDDDTNASAPPSARNTAATTAAAAPAAAALDTGSDDLPGTQLTRRHTGSAAAPTHDGEGHTAAPEPVTEPRTDSSGPGDLEKAPATDTSSPPSGGPPALPKHPAPDCVVFHKDPDKDDFGYKAVLESITNPQTIGWTRGAFRTVAFVSFPLLTIAVHPNTMFRLGFPEMLIAAVVSTSTHRGTLGEQIGLHSWIWRGILYMLVFGTVVDVFQIQRHVGAWYGMLALGIFLAGLVSHGMMRRFIYLYFFIYMMEIRMYYYYFNELPVSNAAWSAADYFLGSVWGMAALCFPYPLLVKDLVDTIMAKIYEGLGKMLIAMVTFLWSPDVHAASLFFNDRSPFVKIEAILEVLPPLLWFANWEPTEFALRNPIRRLKLTLLRRVMALTYAAFGAGLTIAELQKQQADRLAIHRIRVALFHAAHGNDYKAIGDASQCGSDISHQGEEPVQPDVRAAQASIAALRGNSGGCVKEFAVALMQATILIGTTTSTPEQLVKKVPFDALRDKDTVMRRNQRLEMIQVMKIQSDLVASRRRAEQLRKAREEDSEEREGNDNDDNAEEASGDVDVEDANSPFGRTHHYRIGRSTAAMILEHRSILDSTEIFLRMNQIFFHLQLGMIAGEILSFGEQMKTYRPPMSLGRRLWQYFITEPWNDFWEELWCRISFARPCDYRTVKDAIRMTCAYLSATALNLQLWVIPGGLYFFGVTILLGLPVEEESLNMGVNRMAGNSLGCALGYLAYHNANNLAQQLAIALCFCFLQQCAKNHPLYGQTFFYGSIITLAGLVTSMVTMELLTRMIASCYTVMAYMLCCMFIFPNNPIKICWGYRCKLAKVMSEIVDDVVLTVNIKPDCHAGAADVNEETTHSLNEPVAYPHRNTEAMQMCSQLNIQMSLADRLLDMCDKWAPFAARQPIIRGSAPFPAAASAMIQFSHKRMVAHLRMLVFGVQLLHRPRSTPITDRAYTFVGSNVSDFLSEFSDCVRILSQDFIDSVQISRKWSYPLSLSRTSQLSRLRARLHTVHSAGYVTVLENVSKGTFGMTPEDFAQLRREAAERAAEEAARSRGEVRVNAGEGDDTDGPANVSFADRYLAARRLVEAVEGGPTPEAVENMHQSMYLPQPPPGSSMALHGGNSSFIYRAPLEESVVQPNDAFPLTQGSAEREVQQRLREQQRREAEEEEANDRQQRRNRSEVLDATEGLDRHHDDNDGSGSQPRESHEPSYDPVMPRKTPSHVSRLILFPEQGAEAFIPLYRGPAFTYVEDEYSTQQDTDFMAIMTIMCSCDGLMTELEGLTGPVNQINTYQKQLHESSIALGLLDKLSEKLKAMKRENYERYHYPAPPPQKRDALHAQTDPWLAWRF